VQDHQQQNKPALIVEFYAETRPDSYHLSLELPSKTSLVFGLLPNFQPSWIFFGFLSDVKRSWWLESSMSSPFPSAFSSSLTFVAGVDSLLFDPRLFA
jgi:hypothetical protein